MITSFFPMALFLFLTGARITVFGRRHDAKWGPYPIDLPPGDHSVIVSTRYLNDMGIAEIMVPIAPGRETVLYYRAPATVFHKGAIGPVPQKTPGMVVLIVMTIVAIISVVIGAIRIFG